MDRELFELLMKNRIFAVAHFAMYMTQIGSVSEADAVAHLLNAISEAGTPKPFEDFEAFLDSELTMACRLPFASKCLFAMILAAGLTEPDEHVPSLCGCVACRAYRAIVGSSAVIPAVTFSTES